MALLLLVIQGGCASELPVLPDDETGSGSTAVATAGVDTSAGETEDPGNDTTVDETDDTGIEPGCGNGIVEAGELCDATELGAGTCEDLGFGAGTLACDATCGYDTSSCMLTGVPVLELSFSQIKRFDFSWTAVQGAEYYQVLESSAPGEPYVPLGGEVVGESVSFEMPLHFRWQASYVLQACNAAGCVQSDAVDVMGTLAEAVGYVKASNTDAGDAFGASVALSGDGTTLVVGAYYEDSSATGIGDDESDNGAIDSGAVYVFVREGTGTWSQQAYIKASNTGAGDAFGVSVALSGDGDTLAVGAPGEDGTATGIGGRDNDGTTTSGAAYVFVRSAAGAWSQQAYVKASNTGWSDGFGSIVALSGDGDTLAVSAPGEDSNATGVGGDQGNDLAVASGAVYVFVRDGAGMWSQQAYVKALNSASQLAFGRGVALSGDGNTLAVSTPAEAGSGAVYVLVRDGVGMWSQQAYRKGSNTVDGDAFGSSVALSGSGNTIAVGARYESGGSDASGAVYVLVRNMDGTWSEQAYLKASNAQSTDEFGYSVALSEDGSILAIGAYSEDSIAMGIEDDDNASDNSAPTAGAVYVFVRDGSGAWVEQAYVKASNTDESDDFGVSVALSGDGNTLAVGADGEDSNATGIGGMRYDDDSALSSGAVYLY